MAARATRYALWLLVTTGALGGLAGALRPAPTIIQRASDHNEHAAPPGLAGTAELAARNWLTSETRRTTAQGDPIVVDDVALLDAQEIGANYWAATVAATVRTAPPSFPETWFLEVGVAVTNDGLRPTGAPTFVPAPAPLTALATDTAALGPPAADDPAATTATAFLSALLTGDGDPIRYVAPTASINAIGQPPFVDVAVQRMATVATTPELRLRAVVDGTTRDGHLLNVTYDLALGERDGRWEVLSMSGARAGALARRVTPPTPPSTEHQAPATTAPLAPSPGA